MTTKTLYTEVMKMSPAKRLAFANRVLDTVDVNNEELELTAEFQAELERRCDLFEKDPTRSVPLEQFQKRLEHKLKKLRRQKCSG